MLQDLKQSIRRLALSPGFTFMAVLILGLGIGANAAMFSIVDGILFRPQPWEQPDELVWVYQDSDDGEPSSSSYPAFRDMAANTDVFSGTAALIPGRTARMITEAGDAQQVMVTYATSGLFPLLGLRVSRGQWLDPVADEPGSEPAGVVSYPAWQRLFGADPGVVGRSVRLGGTSVTIVGIGPEGYAGEVPGIDTAVWLSISASGPVGGSYYWDTLEHRGDHWFQVVGRLQPGIYVRQAQSAMDVLAQRLAFEFPEHNEGRDITVFSASQVRVHPNEDAMLFPVAGVLMSVVGMVLLIACGNLANLLLARASTRGREVAVRVALGATRWQLVRYLLTESVVLAVVGGAAGLLFAAWAGRALAAANFSMPVPLNFEITLDLRLLVFAFGLSALTGILFGLAPALRASRPDLVPSLKDGDDAGISSLRHSHGWRWLSLRNALVVVQVAISLVLLVGAGLLIRSLLNAQTVDLGFDVDGLAVLQADAGEAGHDAAASERLFLELRDRIAGHPSIEGATLTTRLPVTPGGGSSTLEIEGYEPPTGTGHVEVTYAYIDPDYFGVLRVPLLEGRGFAESDGAETERVAVINEAFATSFWGTSDVVGRRYRHQGYPDSWVRIVGVAGNAKVGTPDEAPTPIFFRPLAQGSGASRLYLVARAAEAPAAAVGMMRTELREIDAEVPVYQAGTMDDHVSAALALPRAAAGMLGLFGGLALLLASLGLYAVVSFAVSRRTTEIGIRIALGANGGTVVGMLVKEMMVVVGAGVLLGLGLSFLAAPVLESLLFNVPTNDPATFAGVAVFLVLVAALAAYLPARRAANTDPMKALRFG
jgi:predicted permease